VRLDPEVRKTLRRLAANPLVGLAVLSGRSLTDIRRRVQLPGVVYGGCHGLEIEGPGLEFRHPVTPLVRRHLERAAATLEAAISRFPGADLERKGPALSLHYRRVVSSGLETLFKLTKEVAAQEGLAILLGDKVWELVPPGHGGKSKALPLIRDHLTKRLNGRPPFAIYAGDDATDAETIRSVGDRGITIQVGGKQGTADYHLRGVSEFHAILRWIEGHRLLGRSHSTTSGGRGAKDSPSDGG